MFGLQLEKLEGITRRYETGDRLRFQKSVSSLPVFFESWLFLPPWLCSAIRDSNPLKPKPN